jgi:hypothetical protein
MLAFSAVFGTALTAKSATAQSLTVDEARAIAKEAYIYGFPLVDSYRVQYSYFVDRGSPEFKAPCPGPDERGRYPIRMVPCPPCKDRLIRI